jgi:hypothetical protein
VFPVLVGMATGRQIHSFSFVPNFDPNDSNLVIAQRLLEPLEDKWQRPADHKRISKIGDLYSKSESEQIMVNPVLLGAIPGGELKITVVGAPTRVAGDIKQELVVVDIENGNSVWVIDGQHRINGMKTSNQPMPFVLLFDERAGQNYTGAYLAELFSIVTTEAKPMKGIHKEWMSYAFQLDKYSKKTKRMLMEVGIKLATTPNFGSGNANENLFYGQIQFNDELGVEGDVVGAFSFTIQNLVKTLDCKPMMELLDKHSTATIAASMSNYVSAFRDLHGQPTPTSLLFGKHGRERYTCIGEGLLEAWLWYLEGQKKSPTYEETYQLLVDRGIGRTNWELLPWTKGPGTNDKNAMRLTMRTVFFQLMQGMEPVPGDLGQYLLGRESTKISLEFGVETDGKFDEASVHKVRITPFQSQDISLDIPSYKGHKRNRLRHHISRSNDPNNFSNLHTPNCRVSSCRLVNERGNLKLPTLETLSALRKQDKGLNIGLGRVAHVELDLTALDEKSPFKINIVINSE